MMPVFPGFAAVSVGQGKRIAAAQYRRGVLHCFHEFFQGLVRLLCLAFHSLEIETVHPQEVLVNAWETAFLQQPGDKLLGVVQKLHIQEAVGPEYGEGGIERTGMQLIPRDIEPFFRHILISHTLTAALVYLQLYPKGPQGFIVLAQRQGVAAVSGDSPQLQRQGVDKGLTEPQYAQAEKEHGEYDRSAAEIIGPEEKHGAYGIEQHAAHVVETNGQIAVLLKIRGTHKTLAGGACQVVAFHTQFAVGAFADHEAAYAVGDELIAGDETENQVSRLMNEHLNQVGQCNKQEPGQKHQQVNKRAPR